MADDVVLSPGVVAATDDVGGRHFSRVKLDLGADGVSTPVVGALPVSQPGLSGGLDHGVVTLTTANTAYVITPPAGCVLLTVRNISASAAVVFIGKAAVTADYNATTGTYGLAPDSDTTRRCGESETFPINATEPIYGVSATAGAVVGWKAVLA
jgi:hypothetical protein